MSPFTSIRPSLVMDTVPPPDTQKRRGRFLVLPSAPDRERMLRETLGSLASELASAESADDLQRRIETAPPDVLILDRAVREFAFLCRTLKTNPALSMPIVVIDWDGGGEEAAVEALDSGADEYVAEPWRRQELRARIDKQLRLKHRLDTLERVRAERNSLRFDANLDSLTGVLNRNALSRSLGRLEHEDAEVSVVFLDVDFFKIINDNFGHAMGDRVLATLGRLLRDHLCPNDLVGRFGGEEFVLVLRDAGSDAALRLSERIRQSISGVTIPGLPRRVTVSAGVATRTPDEAADTLLARADAALYVAKQTGRNRVVLASSVLESAPPDALGRPTRPSELSFGHSAAE